MDIASVLIFFLATALFSVVVVDLPTDCILSFLFPAETDILVPVFSKSTDVVVVNFVAVIKFPIVSRKATSLFLPCSVLFQQRGLRFL